MFKYALFSAPFRPFFWFGSFIGILFPMYWICILVNDFPFSDHFISPVDWHALEMIFGFSLAIITGFLLTASSNWTNSPLMTNGTLLILFSFWFIERVILLIPNIPSYLIFLLHIPFSSMLLFDLFRKFKGDFKRMFIFGGLIGSLFALKMLFLIGVQNDMSEYISTSKEISLFLILLLIVIITGKIIPFFTSKSCPEIKINPKPILEKMSIVSVLISIIFTLFMENPLTLGSLYLVTFVIHCFRWINWKPWQTLGNSLLYSLHLGYAWLLLYLFIKGLSSFYEVLNDDAAALHIFTLGALSVFVYSMMTRVSLGHTGRALRPNKFYIFGMLSINVGALVRVLVPLLLPDYYIRSLHWSMGLWTLGFVIFLISFTTVLWGPRLNNK